MELFLLFIGLFALNVVATRLKQKSRNGKGRREISPSKEGPAADQSSDIPRSLQDLIRRFNEMQQQQIPADSQPEPNVPRPMAPLPEDEYQEPSESLEPEMETKEDLPDVLDEEEAVIEAHREKADKEKIQEMNRAYPEEPPLPKPPPISLAPMTMSASKKRPVPHFRFSVQEASKGFLWAKVIDDPRFRRRSPFRV